MQSVGKITPTRGICFCCNPLNHSHHGYRYIFRLTWKLTGIQNRARSWFWDSWCTAYISCTVIAKIIMQNEGMKMGKIQSRIELTREISVHIYVILASGLMIPLVMQQSSDICQHFTGPGNVANICHTFHHHYTLVLGCPLLPSKPYIFGILKNLQTFGLVF